MENSVNETLESLPEGEGASASPAKGDRARKIISVVFDVILYVFLALCVFLLIVSLVSKKNDGAANIFGYEMRLVVSESMEKNEGFEVKDFKIKDLKLRSAVFIQRVPEDEQKAKEWYAALQVGDVLTFKYRTAGGYEVITHRIESIVPTETGYIITLIGDNRTEGDNTGRQYIYTSPEDYTDLGDVNDRVIGKVVGNSTVIGYIVYGISQPVGLALIIITPCCIIIIWQVMRLASVFVSERKKKAALQVAEAERVAAEESEKRERQARELEELKRKLAELENTDNSVSGDGDDGNVG